MHVTHAEFSRFKKNPRLVRHGKYSARNKSVLHLGARVLTCLAAALFDSSEVYDVSVTLLAIVARSVDKTYIPIKDNFHHVDAIKVNEHSVV